MPNTAAKRRRLVRANGLTMAAATGYVVACAIVLCTWHVLNAERSAVAMERYGTAMAEDLAHLAMEPLLGEDRIRLGRLAERMAKRPEVRRIAVYTVDNRLFVVAGDAPSLDAPAYVRPIAVQDTVAGDVHVTLNAGGFGLSTAQFFADTWLIALIGLALTAAAFHYGSLVSGRRMKAAAALLAEGAAGDGQAEQAYALVARLIGQARSATTLGDALSRGAQIAHRVANLYAGQAVEMPGKGVLLWFRTTAAADRGFEVVCASLLLQRLLEDLALLAPSEPVDGSEGSEQEAPAGASFRYGLDLAPKPTNLVANDGRGRPNADESRPANVLLLSSLAPQGKLVIGRDAYDTLQRPERLRLEALENPAAQALSSTVAVPQGVVGSVADNYDLLLKRQAQVIARAVARSVS